MPVAAAAAASVSADMLPAGEDVAEAAAAEEAAAAAEAPGAGIACAPVDETAKGLHGLHRLHGGQRRNEGGQAEMEPAGL